MWRSLRRISPELTRILSSKRLRIVSKHFSTRRKQACSCSWEELQKHKFRLNKSSLHASSRHLLQSDREKGEKKLDKSVINGMDNGNVNLCNQPSIDRFTDSSLRSGQPRANEVAKGRTLSFPELLHSSSVLQDVVPKNSPAGNDKTSESSPLTTGMVNEFLNNFFRSKRVRNAAQEKGLTDDLYRNVVSQFRIKILMQVKRKNQNMMRTFRAVYLDSDPMANLFPLFMAFAQQKYPVLRCMDEVKKISDLRGPADLYPEARRIKRKIIYHSGPTNSGKTHSAIERFKTAETGIYCGPLRLLATEVFQRTNDAGILCDLLTGEDRQWAISPDQPANHIASTIEMCSTRIHYDCAVIDEIQMMRDTDRGWAWTTSLLGLPCQEIHVCGESSALDLVQRLVTSCDDEMEVRHYERLSPLKVSRKSLGSLGNVRRGDCIVAFSQRNLYQIRRDIERKSKKKCAIIYGGLPPATKVDQAAKFNDPSDECSVLVASDAIGMGLNLNIKRIVFSTLIKYDGTNMVQLTSSQAKQIAGRAGRFGTDHPEGEAMTLHEQDSEVLQMLMSAPTEEVKTAGLAPSMEQIEMLSQELPDASLLKLYEVFESVVQLDGANYFICDFDEKKKIAEKLRGIPLTIKEQYIFSNAPVNTSKLLVVNLAVKFAERVSRDVPVTSAKLERLVQWPPKVPRSLDQLQSLEALHEGLDLYLWLSYRFPEIFVDQEGICEMQQYVEGIIGDVVSSNSLGALTTKPRFRFHDKRLIGWIKRDRFW